MDPVPTPWAAPLITARLALVSIMRAVQLPPAKAGEGVPAMAGHRGQIVIADGAACVPADLAADALVEVDSAAGDSVDSVASTGLPGTEKEFGLGE